MNFIFFILSQNAGDFHPEILKKHRTFLDKTFIFSYNLNIYNYLLVYARSNGGNMAELSPVSEKKALIPAYFPHLQYAVVFSQKRARRPFLDARIPHHHPQQLALA